MVSIKDIYGQLAAQKTVDFASIMKAPLLVPETQKASVLLETFRKTGQRAVLVLDEFGSVMGMVTLIDLMETIVGDVPSMEEQMVMPVRQREDGSWLIDGLFEIEKLPERLEGFVLPVGGGDEFQTVSGWLVKELGRIPVEADRVSAGAWTFEVIDMDSIRVDKVLAVHAAPHPSRLERHRGAQTSVTGPSLEEAREALLSAIEREGEDVGRDT
jgi:putative hemolysin